MQQHFAVKAPFSTIDDGGDFALAGQTMFNSMAPELMSQPHWRFNVVVINLQQIANFDPNFVMYQFAWQITCRFSIVRTYMA